MKSIRLFLVSVLFATMAVVLFIAMLVGYKHSLKQAEALFELELQEKHHIIASLLQQSPTAPGSAIENGSYTTLYQVIDRDGRVVYQSGHFGEKPLPATKNGISDFNFDGRRWHALQAPAPNLPFSILVAEQDDLRFRLADALIVDMLKPLLAGLFCMVLLVWIVVETGFKPIRRLTDAIREKSASDLSALPTHQIPAELQAISASVNELFVRLTNAFEREKRFTADAAHEMRNPITALKIHIDNLLEEIPEKSDSLLKIKHAIDRLSGLVDQMLVLHRMSPDQYQSQFSCIPLHGLIQDVIAEMYPEIDKKSQTIELDGNDCYMQADLFGMEVLLKNLIGNASKYTPAGGAIRVQLLDNSAGKNEVILRIEDSGVGIPASEHQRVFDRFYRVGGDRHDPNTQGSGLGLSIVRHIAELHQAQLALKHSTLGGLCVELCFPAKQRCDNGASAP